MDKIQRKAEDKLVDELSEKLANQAVKPINSFVDSLMVESYEQNTGEKYDPDNSQKMADALNSFLGTAEVPDNYKFNYKMIVETKDFGSKKSNEMEMLVSDEQAIFGIVQEEDDKKMMIVFDNVNECMVSYDLQKNEFIAIPLNASMMTAFNGMANTEVQQSNLRIEKMAKGKDIIGYYSEGYRYISDDTNSDVYISKELPFTWDDSFGKLLKQFAPNFYKENEEYQIDGMLMEAVTKRDEDGKKSEWKTKKLIQKDFEINNSDYTRSNYGSDQ